MAISRTLRVLSVSAGKALREPRTRHALTTCSRRYCTASSPRHVSYITSARIRLPTPHRSFASASAPTFKDSISIDIDGKQTTFDSVFLRDSCRCPHCVDPSTSQKNFQTADIPANVQASAEVITTPSGPSVVINWKNDIPSFSADHQTVLSLSFLRHALSPQKPGPVGIHTAVPARKLWNRDSMATANTFYDYSAYMSDDRTLYTVLKQLHTHGLAFLSNIPDTSQTNSSTGVVNITNRIGHLRETFYGRTWDVKSVPNAKNVAYTNVYLGFHMDLCYMDLTPRFQLLHSLRARAPGGESMFADAFAAAERMRTESPDLFHALRTFPVTYHYFNAGHAYRQIRPTIELLDPSDPTSDLALLNWSPPFQGPFVAGIDGTGVGLRTYLAAAKRFDELVNKPENVFELRMEEGQCVLFDNRRVLHARRAFDVQAGERWLKGTYLDRDVWASRFEVLRGVYEGK
ncbi:Clavaminate synthase-like protein [Trichodelitschia bisporula]|uniref:Clavaminate synthase-like protein n=1 Tax=Trichodelitschia bisporula TaxID=703511 RepID=A0A6G1HWL1_9PEZI|nr:Clavaminate synthase-like protein [Trichodelitschia bisporula]